MTDLYDRMREEGLMDPLLVRASIECSIGENLPYPTAAAMAHDIGVHPEQLYQFLRGKRQNLEPKLAKALNMEKVVFYRPLNKTACNPEKGRA